MGVHINVDDKTGFDLWTAKSEEISDDIARIVQKLGYEERVELLAHLTDKLKLDIEW